MTVDSAHIERAIGVLLGKPLWGSHRVVDVQAFKFGAQVVVLDRRHGTRVVGEIALHIQCAWRIVGPAGIIAASQDRYVPAGDPRNEPSDFRWDVLGANRCDERIEALFEVQLTSALLLTEVVADEVGSFSLTFTDGFRLDVFPDSSLTHMHDEYWRLLEPAMESGHFVISGSGIDDGRVDWLPRP